jgi:hypothetical protein
MATSDPQPNPKKLSIASDVSGPSYHAIPAREITPIPSNLDDRDLILREQFSVDDLRLIALWLSGFAGDYRLHGGPDHVEDFIAALTARVREISRIPVTQPGGASVEED